MLENLPCEAWAPYHHSARPGLGWGEGGPVWGSVGLPFPGHLWAVRAERGPRGLSLLGDLFQ